MERQGTFKPICEFEAEQLRRGELPDRVAMGAWRALQPGEIVDPRHIQEVRGVESIPARLYGNLPLGTEINPNSQTVEPTVYNVHILEVETPVFVGS